MSPAPAGRTTDDGLFQRRIDFPEAFEAHDVCAEGNRDDTEPIDEPHGFFVDDQACRFIDADPEGAAGRLPACCAASAPARQVERTRVRDPRMLESPELQSKDLCCPHRKLDCARV